MKTFFKILLVIISIIIIYTVYKNSTTPKDIGLLNGNFYPLKNSPNGVSTQAVNESKLVQPIPMQIPLDESKVIMDAIIRNHFKSKQQVNEKTYSHWIIQSKFFAFNDDLEIHFDDTHQLIHFRSQSRVGYSDMGVNRQRFDTIKRLYDEIIANQTK